MLIWLMWITFWMLMVGVSIVAATAAGEPPIDDDHWLYVFFWPILLPIAVYQIYEKKNTKE